MLNIAKDIKDKLKSINGFLEKMALKYLILAISYMLTDALTLKRLMPSWSLTLHFYLIKEMTAG